MISLGFQSRPLDPSPCATSHPTCRVSLRIGGNLAFSSGHRGVDVRILSGSVWLSDDPTDHVLPRGSSHHSPRDRRVLITALADAEVEVRPVV